MLLLKYMYVRHQMYEVNEAVRFNKVKCFELNHHHEENKKYLITEKYYCELNFLFTLLQVNFATR